MSDDNRIQNSIDDQPKAMLSAIEARILGTLMEKQLTTPDQYPLTLNSLVTGCNQKTSREPVSNYSKGDIEHCVNKLRERKLLEVEYGSRASRFDQRLTRTLFLDKPAQALLTIMLLRGPQTINELLNRTDRMTRFESPAVVQDILTTLCQKTSPVIVHIPRQSGQREDRYMHLLCGKPDLSVWLSSATSDAATGENSNSDLMARVEELERQLAKIINHLGLNGE
jgi:hypothetical protein